ncbi:MAG: OadG family protein [Paramuribaculum sp.]|nr:OadG family protein [Paramuribaculum sp.]
MKKKLTLLLVAVMACMTIASAQGRRGLRINEIMVQNDSNFVDDYGQRSAWVELFNSTFAPLEISSIYITNDKEKKTKYPVPLGDVNTKMPKRQHVLFWADSDSTRGTFHMNFTLEPGVDNWIGIYDADGLTLIDEVLVPASLLPNQSYARVYDGVDGENGEPTWEIRDNVTKPVTPSSNNQIRSQNTKVATFSKEDKNGFAMTIMAMGIVFSALLMLSICFYIISKIGAKSLRDKKAKAQGTQVKGLPKSERPNHDTGEEIAAIVMALHEHLNVHDSENTILTINKVKRAYSPWSSKIYGLREIPRR